jgi:predicted transcriptional regulator YheO
MPIQKRSFSDLKQLADAIVAMFGRSCEVAIHDLTDLRKSLVYISGEVTGRKIGAPATDLLVKAISNKNSEIKDMYNYKTTAKDGRSIKSSTIFLRDGNDDAAAAFCINLDTTDFFNATQALSALLNHTNTNGNELQETFASSIGETIEELFEQALIEVGKQPASMTTEEKIQLTSLLEEQGVFRMKGAVNQVAELTGVSNFTIYNYLKKIRKTSSHNKIMGEGASNEKTNFNR